MEQENKVILGYIDGNIAPKIDDISMIAEKYEKVGKVLGATTLFQSGSYPRYTSIRPINDLDIIKVLPLGKSFNEAEKSLMEVYKLLDTVESRAQIGHKKLKLQKSSIRIYFDEDEDEDKFSIDIVPAIETDKKDVKYGTMIYQVPEIQEMNKHRRLERYKDINYKDNRISSAPKAYKAYAEHLDGISNNNFRYFVRFIKKWKRACKKEYPGFCLKSFHLEQICGEIVDEYSGGGIHNLITFFFDAICDIMNHGEKFKDLAYAGIAGQERYIDEYVADPSKNTPEFREWLRKETVRVKFLIGKMDVSVTEEEIVDLLDQILREKEKRKDSHQSSQTDKIPVSSYFGTGGTTPNKPRCNL